jgi:PAS domain S-box-containing protein
MGIGSPKSKLDLFDNNRFGEVIERFEAEERRLLMLRSRSLQEEQQLNTSFIWGGSGIGAVGMLVALRILQQLSIELHARQSRLSESQCLIRTLVANVVDGVAIVDARGKIQSFNQAAVEMFGYPPDEVVGDDWHKLLAPAAEVNQSLLSHPADALQAVVSSGQSQQAMGQRKNGDWFPIEFSIDTVADDALVATQQDRIIFIRDITERQQVAARLFATNRQLVDLNIALNVTNRSLLASNRELDQFAYITAHDLKAPLRAIASLSEWIEEELAEQLSTETRSQMQLLRCRVCRMQALLDSLLEYSRSGRTQKPISRVDINSLLTEIVESLVPPATMTIEIRAPMPIFNTRKQPLQQVFSHLIDNAIRHHPTTKVGRVEISAIDLEDRYEFTIADDGDGIDPQFHDRIYTIFQTLTARDRQENVGVGLAIVKKIVTAEGGTIELDSAVGRGATFKFTWLKQPIAS